MTELKEVEKILRGTFTVEDTWVLGFEGENTSQRLLINLRTNEERKLPVDVLPPDRAWIHGYSNVVWNYASRKGINGGTDLLDVRGDVRNLKTEGGTPIGLTYPYLGLLGEVGSMVIWDVETDSRVTSFQTGLILARPSFHNHFLILASLDKVLVWREKDLLRGEGKSDPYVTVPYPKVHSIFVGLGNRGFGFWDKKVLTTYNFKGKETGKFSLLDELTKKFGNQGDNVPSLTHLQGGKLLVTAREGKVNGLTIWSFKRGKFGKFLNWRRGSAKLERSNLRPLVTYIPSLNSLLLFESGNNYLFNLKTGRRRKLATKYLPQVLNESPLVSKVLRCVLLNRLNSYLPRDLILETWNFFH